MHLVLNELTETARHLIIPGEPGISLANPCAYSAISVFYPGNSMLHVTNWQSLETLLSNA